MTIRKCIYTGEDSKLKDRVLPNPALDDEIHNWSNYAPISPEYRQIKGDNLPTEIEMELNETFKLLELAKLRVKFYESKLKELQKINLKNKPKVKKKVKIDEHIKKCKSINSKIEKEKDIAIKTQELTENVSKDIDKLLQDRKKLWD